MHGSQINAIKYIIAKYDETKYTAFSKTKQKHDWRKIEDNSKLEDRKLWVGFLFKHLYLFIYRYLFIIY